jgi:hypothetical protein
VAVATASAANRVEGRDDDDDNDDDGLLALKARAAGRKAAMQNFMVVIMDVDMEIKGEERRSNDKLLVSYDDQEPRNEDGFVGLRLGSKNHPRGCVFH